MGCCPSTDKNRSQPLYPTGPNHMGAGRQPIPLQQQHVQPPPPQQPYFPQPPPPQPYYPPPQQPYYPPPPGYGYPPPVQQQQDNGTRNTLLGAGAGILGGLVLADALDGGLFD